MVPRHSSENQRYSFALVKILTRASKKGKIDTSEDGKGLLDLRFREEVTAGVSSTKLFFLTFGVATATLDVLERLHFKIDIPGLCFWFLKDILVWADFRIEGPRGLLDGAIITKKFNKCKLI